MFTDNVKNKPFETVQQLCNKVLVGNKNTIPSAASLTLASTLPSTSNTVSDSVAGKGRKANKSSNSITSDDFGFASLASVSKKSNSICTSYSSDAALNLITKDSAGTSSTLSSIYAKNEPLVSLSGASSQGHWKSYKSTHPIGSRKASESVVTYHEPMFQSVANSLFENQKNLVLGKRKVDEEKLKAAAQKEKEISKTLNESESVECKKAKMSSPMDTMDSRVNKKKKCSIENIIERIRTEKTVSRGSIPNISDSTQPVETKTGTNLVQYKDSVLDNTKDSNVEDASVLSKAAKENLDSCTSKEVVKKFEENTAVDRRSISAGIKKCVENPTPMLTVCKTEPPEPSEIAVISSSVRTVDESICPAVNSVSDTVSGIETQFKKESDLEDCAYGLKDYKHYGSKKNVHTVKGARGANESPKKTKKSQKDESAPRSPSKKKVEACGDTSNKPGVDSPKMVKPRMKENMILSETSKSSELKEKKTEAKKIIKTNEKGKQEGKGKTNTDTGKTKLKVKPKKALDENQIKSNDINESTEINKGENIQTDKKVGKQGIAKGLKQVNKKEVKEKNVEKKSKISSLSEEEQDFSAKETCKKDTKDKADLKDLEGHQKGKRKKSDDDNSTDVLPKSKTKKSEPKIESKVKKKVNTDKMKDNEKKTSKGAIKRPRKNKLPIACRRVKREASLNASALVNILCESPRTHKLSDKRSKSDSDLVAKITSPHNLTACSVSISSADLVGDTMSTNVKDTAFTKVGSPVKSKSAEKGASENFSVFDKVKPVPVSTKQKTVKSPTAKRKVSFSDDSFDLVFEAVIQRSISETKGLDKKQDKDGRGRKKSDEKKYTKSKDSVKSKVKKAVKNTEKIKSKVKSEQVDKKFRLKKIKKAIKITASKSPVELAEKKRKASLARLERAKELLITKKRVSNDLSSDSSSKSSDSDSSSNVSEEIEPEEIDTEDTVDSDKSKELLKKERARKGALCRAARTHVLVESKTVVENAMPSPRWCECCQSTYYPSQPSQGAQVWRIKQLVDKGSSKSPEPIQSSSHHFISAHASCEVRPYASPSHMSVLESNPYVGPIVQHSHIQCSACSCGHSGMFPPSCQNCTLGGVMSCQRYGNAYSVTYPHSHGSYTHCGKYCSIIFLFNKIKLKASNV